MAIYAIINYDDCSHVIFYILYVSREKENGGKVTLSNDNLLGFCGIPKQPSFTSFYVCG